MEQKINPFIYWTPRILSIIFLLFLAMFSLDVFDMKLGFWETVLGLLMHNLPVIVLLIILLISWKREIVGGIAFTLAGILYAVMMSREILKDSFEWYMIFWVLAISGPSILIGILFLFNWFKKKKQSAGSA